MDESEHEASEHCFTRDFDSQLPPSFGTIKSHVEPTPASTGITTSAYGAPSTALLFAHDATRPRVLLNDNIYAPSTFHGKSTKNAQEYLAYVQRFAAYKDMHQDEMLELMPVFLRDTASDFYDNLAPDARATWQDFKRAFLERFGRSKLFAGAMLVIYGNNPKVQMSHVRIISHV